MKSLLSVLLLISCSYALQDSTYYAYWENDSLMGYRDADSNIVIQPNSRHASGSQNFVNVTPVVIRENERYHHYYLRRDGSTFGRDSVYFFENSGDTESEGFIRFRDPESELMGMFSHTGKVVIPAEYNALRHVRNGMIVGLKGATRIDEKHDYGCNHYRLEGGTTVLIDTLNHILVDSFPNSEELNFFSLKKIKTPGDTAIHRNYPAKNGVFYSFIDYEKEFSHWLINTFLEKNRTAEFLIKHSYDSISCSSDEYTTIENRDSFIKANFRAIVENIHKIKSTSSKTFISQGYVTYSDLDVKRYVEPDYRRDKYPVFSVIINSKSDSKQYQNAFDFLRTENGYRLISVLLRGKEEIIFTKKR